MALALPSGVPALRSAADREQEVPAPMPLGHEVKPGDPLSADFENLRGLRLRGALVASLFGLVVWSAIAGVVVAVCR